MSEIRFSRSAGKAARWASCVAAVALLSACDLLNPVDPVPIPPSRPASLVPAAVVVPQRSVQSETLRRYYAQVQSDLQTRGLLRTDGGGPDTPFDAEDLVRNFEAIAFFDEYARGTGISQRGGGAGLLRRWSGPVRIGMEFGASIMDDQEQKDRGSLNSYAGRLARATQHPISVGGNGANFHVLFMSEDDRDELRMLLRRLVPNASQQTLNIFTNLPRSIHCLVVAFSEGDNPQDYTKAVALVRAEHPDLVRLSCIHEEVAQGLGLANDSPQARPSIFNDDDEFALLTNHDELLLRMLYDPRLKQGMSAEQARPIARIVARELMGQSL
ncbi:DUF2927 domain-containing protein [Thalassococcus sp. S3]|uniref:DUF2927 domain-containing protein n=1 Tax=Thalassococcus sp. S3 TaxID=2017482 RepID=UPI0010246DFB|nr:DUF2927 domain-containing protein [Thalassococcus sp. S3]QBF31116.1 hypothetical protein CFI11_07770 [Thalassococcus sp. S3]